MPRISIRLVMGRVVVIGLVVLALGGVLAHGQEAQTETLPPVQPLVQVDEDIQARMQPPVQPYLQGGGETQTRVRPFVHPYIQTWYDARANRTLATCSAGVVTEQDLLLYRMMKRETNPAVFQTWARSRSAAERQRATRGLEEAIQRYVFTLTLAESAPNRLSATDQKFIRFLEYPVYQWVWIERVLKPQIKIEQTDLIKYYHDHIERFYKPESVRVRYIFREVPKDADVAKRDELMNQMKALRERAAAGEDFVELARAHSDAPSAVRGGELPLIYRGGAVEEFESHAFALQTGQISPVFWAPGGLYFVQSLEKRPEQVVKFEQARNDLIQGVERQTLAYLFDHELIRKDRRTPRRYYVGRLFDLGPHEPMIEIGNYGLAKDEFLQFFPYVLSEPLRADTALIGGLARGIIYGELVAQDIERRGLGGDPLLVAAHRLSEKMWRSSQALRSALKVPLILSEADVRKYYEENRDRLGYQPQWRVFELSASIVNPYLRQATQMEALRAEMRSQFDRVLRDFLTAWREEQFLKAEQRTVAGEETSAPLTAAAILDDEASTATLIFRRQLSARPRSLDAFTSASTTDFLFTARDLGFLSFKDELVFKAIKGLRAGQAGAVRESAAGSCSCYFIERYIPGEDVEYDKVRPHARQQYIVSLQARTLGRLREEMERKSALDIRLPEVVPQEE
ncbi:peptidyl-prolyl cis-trans isomerase [Candidatus Sumerlaeota bacterium]|nr:peptidyl-prolyl cis-trans isomerase [Candidatus Sumerlaeota bacterium]